MRFYWVTLTLVTALAATSQAQVNNQLRGGAFAKLGKGGEVAKDMPQIWVRPGYKVERVVSGLANTRFMEFGTNGTLYVSRPNIGDIQTFKWSNGTLKQVATFVEGKRSTHGLCFANGWLYYSTTFEVWRARDTNGDGKADENELVLGDGKIQGGGGHWWRPVLVTEDSVYTSIGDGGNINDETEQERQKIWKFDLKGGNKTLFASGLRNTEKYRVRPGTKEIWGMDHGSDNWGKPLGETEGKNQPLTNIQPPDEFNMYVQGGFYGHPFIEGDMVPRYEYMKKENLLELANKTTIPEWKFGAHWAMNGFCFVTKSTSLGQEHIGNAICASHGSWNSTTLVGYRVEEVLFDQLTGKPYGSLCLVSCVSADNKALARPVDCVEAPDGSILFSCDQTNSIYRITRKK